MRRTSVLKGPFFLADAYTTYSTSSDSLEEADHLIVILLPLSFGVSKARKVFGGMSLFPLTANAVEVYERINIDNTNVNNILFMIFEFCVGANLCVCPDNPDEHKEKEGKHIGLPLH
ncbi:MAG: hypothetical protein HN862_00875 [Candidatus Scalindua sp.]|nr:hypothetical protein [Candidatus Scalindua sp.]